MKDSFATYHPIVNFTYFAAVIGFAMFIMQPVCMVISLASALVYSTYIGGKKAVAFNVKVMIPMLIIAGLMNPIFNHEGATIIIYLKDGNPLTLESIMFGIAAAAMIISVMLWFSCYNQVMTSDKFIYLFGRVIPALSLIIAMALRFIPRFKAQLKVIINAQKCLGRDISSGSLWQRLVNSLKILSILISWALENAIETGDSMKSRGYGLPGRTAFSIYEFDQRDKWALLFLLANIGLVFVGIYHKGIYFRYFPTLKGELWCQLSIVTYMAYSLILNTPVILNIREDLKWKTLKSRI